MAEIDTSKPQAAQSKHIPGDSGQQRLAAAGDDDVEGSDSGVQQGRIAIRRLLRT